MWWATWAICPEVTSIKRAITALITATVYAASLAALPILAAPVQTFGLPFSAAPGPNTWLLDQHFGNTIEAYTYGKYWYTAGQGLHFGVDFDARCGTPIIAIADGVVDWIDNGSFGAEPHNLVLRHEALGYVSVYGHLLDKPALKPGQTVRRGEVIAKVGDPDLTCVSRPHLHLEIRSLDYRTAYDPARLIAADWDMLSTLADAEGVGFARDLYAPRRQVTIATQPDVAFGGRILNRFEAVWPPPDRVQAPPVTLPGYVAPDVATNARAVLKRLSAPGCCVAPWWSPDSQSVRYLDGPAGELASLMAVPVEGAPVPARLGEAPPSSYSPNVAYAVRVANGGTSVIRERDGASWLLATSETWPVFSPESRQLLWQVRSADYFPNYPQPLTEIHLATVGADDSRLIRVQKGGSAHWLDENRLLLVETYPNTQGVTLSIYTISTGQIETLAAPDFMHDLTVAPGGQYLMYLQQLQDGGVYLLETKPGARPQKLPFLGAWRWRDSRSVLYIPFTPGSPSMALSQYDVRTGQSRRLNTPPFVVANADWQVSPDGMYVAFVEARDQAIWLLSLPGYF